MAISVGPMNRPRKPNATKPPNTPRIVRLIGIDTPTPIKKGPDAALGEHCLAPDAGEAIADDRQTGKPGGGLRSASEVVLETARPLRQTLGEAGRHRQQGQDNDGEREEQQQRGVEPALQPASEQEIAQRPRGNGQDRAEQDCGGEGSQHR